MLQRILLVVLVLFVVWRLLSAMGRRLGQQSPGADSYSRFSPNKRRRRREWARSGSDDGPERLVACSHCGTLVPAGRALAATSGETFCSPECRDRSRVTAKDVN